MPACIQIPTSSYCVSRINKGLEPPILRSCPRSSLPSLLHPGPFDLASRSSERSQLFICKITRVEVKIRNGRYLQRNREELSSQIENERGNIRRTNEESKKRWHANRLRQLANLFRPLVLLLPRDSLLRYVLILEIQHAAVTND